MDNQQIEQTIRSYLPQVIHMSLATVADNKPWVCELHYAYDDELNIYWMSAQQVRHSREVAANPQVAGNVVTQHHLQQLVRGVYFEGRAEMLAEVDENSTAYKVYSTRFGDRAAAILPAYQDAEGPRIYKLTVSDFYLVDGMTTGKPQKLHLPWKQ